MADIDDAYGLPDALPPLRLPSDAELARQARAIPLLRELAALAEWLGEDGRSVDDHGNLTKDARDDALSVLGVPPERLGVLWKYALTVDWVTTGAPDGAGGRTAGRAFPGAAAETWARGGGTAADEEDSGEQEGGEKNGGEDPRDEDALDAWASAFTAVLSEAICAAAGDHGEPEGIDIHVPGAAIAMVLFLNRRDGLYREDARALVREVVTGELSPDRAKRAWSAWVSAHGDPADVLLTQLAEAGAVTLPLTDDGTIRFTPLALREMRLQLTNEGVDIPLFTASTGELTESQLIALAEGIPAEEFETEADAWLMAQGPERSAALLLDLATRAGPAERLTAVSVVTRAGAAAEQAWRDSIDVPALRPYAKVALASLVLGVTHEAPAVPGGIALLPESVPPEMIPPELRPLPDDLAWLATDVLALACADEDTDPQAVAAAFAQSVPPGDEVNALDRLWRSPHPDAERVLNHLGRFHPDKQVAKEARRAAHKAAGRRRAGGHS